MHAEQQSPSLPNLTPPEQAALTGGIRSASICGRLIVSCRSSRLGSFACSSPLRGRPRLRRRFGFAAFGFG